MGYGKAEFRHVRRLSVVVGPTKKRASEWPFMRSKVQIYWMALATKQLFAHAGQEQAGLKLRS